MAQGPFDHAFCRRMAAALSQDIFRQGTCIDADTDGDSLRTYFFDDFDDIVVRSDIARIDAQGLDAAVDGGQGQAVIEVDIGDNGDIHGLNDGGQAFGRFHIGNGKAQDFSAIRCQAAGIDDGFGHMGRVDRRHGLDRYGCIAADGDAARLDGKRFSTFHARPAFLKAADILKHGEEEQGAQEDGPCDLDVVQRPFRHPPARNTFENQ